jgi:hypothetical protein
MSGGGGEGVAASQNQLNLSIGGSTWAGSATATSGATLTLGTLPSNSIE